MANFFKSLFSGNSESSEESKAKTEKKNFELFKYDGMRAERLGDINYAIKCYTQALAISDDFETLGYLSKAYIMQNELDKALLALDKMVEIDPSVATTELHIAHVSFLLEKYSECIEHANKTIMLDEKNVSAFLLLAKANQKSKDPINAIVNLTKAIAIKEDYTDAYLLRAEILKDVNESKSAFEDVEKVLELVPEEEVALLLRGKLKEQAGRIEEAKADYTLVTELNPFNQQAYLYLGQLLISEKKFTEAIGCLDEAIELNPKFGEAYHERGRAKFLNDDKEGSLEDMKLALEINPEKEKGLEGEFDNFSNIYSGAKLF